MSDKLPNYLRTYRKRSGLSQKEVAWLLGCKHGTKVSRYERHARLPNLETALALEMIFRMPSQLLFLGMYRDIQARTYKQARRLAERIAQAPPTPARAYKLASVERIYGLAEGASPAGDNPPPYEHK